MENRGNKSKKNKNFKKDENKKKIKITTKKTKETVSDLENGITISNPNSKKQSSVGNTKTLTPRVYKAKSIPTKKKKSKYEEKWENHVSNDMDIFGCVEDPTDHILTNQDDEKKGKVFMEESNKWVEEPKEYKIIDRKAIVANHNTAMEITKNGYVRTDAEIAGIAKKKREKRAERKKLYLSEKNSNKKETTRVRRLVTAMKQEVSHSSQIILEEEKKEPTSTSKFREKKLQKKKAPTNDKRKLFTKQEKADFRKFMERRKAHLKKKKKERQANRITTESGAYADGDDDDLYCAPFGVKDVESTLLSDIISKVDENKKYIKILFLIHMLYESNSLANDIVIVSNYFLERGVPTTERIVTLCTFPAIKMFKNYREKQHKVNTIHTESFSDFLGMLSRETTALFDCDLANAIQNLLTVGYSWEVIPDSNALERIKKFIPVFKKNMPIKETITRIFESFATIVRMIELLLAGYPLSEVFFSPDPVRASLDKADFYLEYANNVHFGRPIGNSMCAKQFMSETEQVVLDLGEVKKRISKMAPAYKQIVEREVVLETARKRLHVMTHRQIRPTPVAVILHGDPGIGKSSVSNFIYQTHSFVKGRRPKHTDVFDKVVTSDYWDGYSPDGTPYIHFSEIGCLTEKFAQARGDPSVMELTSIIDSLPKQLNMSDVKDKGEVYCRAELVLIDTNNPNLNLNVLVNNPSAYRRRFVYIEPIVKPEFRAHGTSMLDPNIEIDGIGYYDKWYFNVTTHSANGKTKTIEHHHLKASEKHNIHDLERFLLKHFAAHIDRTHNELANREKNYYEDKMVGVPEESGVTIVYPEKKPSSALTRIYNSIFEDSAKERSLRKETSILNSQILTARLKRLKAGKHVLPAQTYLDVALEIKEDEKVHTEMGHIYDSSIMETKDDILFVTDNDDCEKEQIVRLNTEIVLHKRAEELLIMEKEPVVPVWQIVLTWLIYISTLSDNVIVTIADLCVNAFLVAWFQSRDLSDVIKICIIGVLLITSFVYYPLSYSSYFMIYLFVRINYRQIFFLMLNHGISDYKKSFNTKVNRLYLNCSQYVVGLTGKVMSLPTSDVSGMVVATGSIALVGLLISRFISDDKKSDKTKKVISESSRFREKDDVTKELQDIEDKYDCGQSYVRIPIKNTKIWNSRTLTPSVHRSGLDELFFSITRNVRRMKIFTSNGTITTHALGVKDNYALINMHSFGVWPSSGKITVETSVSGGLEKTGGWRGTIVSKKVMIQVSSDIYLVPLFGVQFSDIIKHFPLHDEDFDQARGRIGNAEIVVKYGPQKITADDDNIPEAISFDGLVTYTWLEHQKGSCGLPVVIQRDLGSCVGGLHCAAADLTSECYAVRVTRTQINEALLLMPMPSVRSESEHLEGGAPHHKSPIRYEPLGSIEYKGALEITGPRQKSKLEKSIFYNQIDKILGEHMGYFRTILYAKPLLQPRGTGENFVSPYNVAIRKMAIDKKPLDMERLDDCVNVAFNQIRNNLEKRKSFTIQPLDVDTALNGVSHDAFIRRISMNKAAGYGTAGKKKDHTLIHEDDEIYDVYFEPNSDIKKEIVKIIRLYSSGQSYGPIYKAALKDEPREIEKVMLGKTRVFYASSYAHLLVCRMFLSPLYTLMNEFSEDFYCAIGIDMIKNGHAIFNRMNDFSQWIIEGDYGGYDISMAQEVSYAAKKLILLLCEAFGYNTEQLKIVDGILSDDCVVNILLLGELLQVFGLQPSGKFATAENNSLKNLLLMLYFFSFVEDVSKFFDYCLPVSYGDDLIIAVKDEIKCKFGALSYKKICERETDMTFTSASKGEISADYLHVTQMSFLKRNFIYSNILRRYVAVLSLDSIIKALEWRLPSDSVNEFVQSQQTLASMLWELFLHLSDDEKTFNIIRTELKETILEFFEEFTVDLPTYDQILEELQPQNKIVVLGGRQREFFENSISTESGGWDDYVTELEEEREDYTDNNVYAFGRVFTLNEWSENKKSIITQELLRLVEEETKLSEEYQMCLDITRGRPLRKLRMSPMYSQNSEYREAIDEFCRLQSNLEAVRFTIRRLRDYLDAEGAYHMHTESGSAPEMKVGNVSPPTETHENVVDMAGDEKDMVSADPVHVVDVGQKEQLYMSDFLSRPLTLTNFEVDDLTNIDYSIDLWDQFLSHPSIRSKIRNYAYIKATMNVRVTISGSPFHYGKVLVSYQPLAGYNANLPFIEAQLAIPTQRTQGLTYLSQSEFARVMDVRANKPLEMMCPYISPQPMLRLFNKSPLVIAEGTPYNDAVGFGTLYVQSINPVRAASPNPSRISVFVYAWMTDVELGCPTGTVIAIGTESGKLDEREIGPVEKFASRSSAMSKLAMMVPDLEPFAAASSLVFEGLEQFSALFGFSVPTMINEPWRTKNEPYQNGSNLIGYDTGKRIVLDPKQELSVDPRALATSRDDMALAAIAETESLLDTFEWSSNEIPLTTSLWSVPVNPGLVKKIALGAPTPYQVVPTPLAFVAAPFTYWRGDITFRIEIACSQYHRGKLAIYFEPNISQHVVIDTELETNKRYMKIIDIQQTQDVSITVNWAFPRAWAKVLRAQDFGSTPLGQIGFSGDSYFDFANGYLAITPFTTLQSPDNSDVSVNVYICSENIQFNVMNSNLLPTQRPSTESGRLSPETPTSMVLNPSSATMEHISEDHFGEVPFSFRALLKRFTSGLTERYPVTIADNVLYFDATLPNHGVPYPQYNGVSIDSRYADLYGYLRYAYMGIRGGMKRRFYLAGNITSHNLHQVKISLDAPTTVNTTSFSNTASFDNYVNRINGCVNYIPHTNGGVEFEVPFYSNNLYGISFSDDIFPPNSIVEQTNVRNFSVITAINPRTAGVLQVFFDRATAEDFSFMRFQGAPVYLTLS